MQWIAKKITPELRKKIIEILITAVLSAAIAALQGILTSYTSQSDAVANPEVAAGIGGAIRAACVFIKPKLC